MAPQKNLLEAFRSAGGPAATPVPPPPAPVPPPSGGGDGPDVPLEEGLRLSALPPWLPLAIAAGVAFLIGVLVGRVSVGTSGVEAAAATEDAGLAAPRRPAGGERAGERPVEGGADVDPNAPLLDTANQFTLVVATYDAGRKDYADAAYFELLDAGLRVFHPYAQGNHWLVLVGASPTAEGLDAAKRRVHELRNGVYGDAYAQRIDKLIAR